MKSGSEYTDTIIMGADAYEIQCACINGDTH